ncbi:hypothetical protein Q8F55_000324 [Vanrija albida]|uniref:RING-type domain-containing protein n=1 Tax=Vanrija albida TaxID=181172 RepID=A0ABR3QDH9_9TREE
MPTLSAASGPGRPAAPTPPPTLRARTLTLTPRRALLATALLTALGLALTWPALLATPPLASSRLDTRAAFARVVDPAEPWPAWLDADADPQYGTADLTYAGGTPSAEGWLTHWLSMGGEGALTVMLAHTGEESDNVTFPHRPAAFPSFLQPSADLPVAGVLVPFVSLKLPGKHADTEAEAEAGKHEAPERACLPPAWPPIRPHPPKAPYTVALVERGGCDFATKVRAAQERGAAAVIVGDSRARADETDEEGRSRENLITMFSPEDTTGIIIPSVFVSRASYLTLRDLLANHTVHGHPGLHVELGEATDDGNALGSLLTFALLMPSLFLLATIVAHRVRIARQREANRAPPTVVLSLPERVWTPDIVWEKDDSDESDKDTEPENAGAGDSDIKAPRSTPGSPLTTVRETSPVVEGDGAAGPTLEVPDAPAPVAVVADDAATPAQSPTAPAPTPRKPKTAHRGKKRRPSKRYYSKDECAICMDNFHAGEVVRILPCGHVFHKDECDEWLLKWRKLCPTCRADVTIPASDLSSSATLTPVVDRSDPTAQEPYDAAGNDAENATWRDRESVRAAVRRPADAIDERTPLVPHDAV